jgi:hypothetical protein
MGRKCLCVARKREPIFGKRLVFLRGLKMLVCGAKTRMEKDLFVLVFWIMFYFTAELF